MSSPEDIYSSLIPSIASSFEEVERAKHNGKSCSSIPTPLMIYQCGLILHETSSCSDNNLSQSFNSILQSLPASYLKVILEEINEAFVSSCSSISKSIDDSSVKSVCGLYSHSKSACEFGFNLGVCSSLIEYYNNNDNDGLKMVLLALSNLLVSGWIPTLKKGSEDDKLHRVMEDLQSLSGGTCLGDVLQWEQDRIPQRSSDNSSTLKDALSSLFSEDNAQYVLQILESMPTTPPTQHSPAEPPSTQPRPTTTTTTTPSSSPSLVTQVNQILPHLGSGYIETALACYNFSPETTIAALTGPPTDLHPRLVHLDPNLPQRTSRNKDQHYDPLKADPTALETQKQFFEKMERNEEEEIYRLERVLAVDVVAEDDNNEYNDDYDDQYDGVGCGECNDVGMYDYDDIKVYNRFVKDMVAEDQFWNDNRNINRSSQTKTPSSNKNEQNDQENDNDDKGDEEEQHENGEPPKKQWGPDKGKGGRIIGPDGKYLPFPKRNQKKSSSTPPKQQQAPSKTKGNNNNNKKPSSNNNDEKKQSSSSSEMSKLQKRRKNDKKAKIANHHRKERALKKQGGV